MKDQKQTANTKLSYPAGMPNRVLIATDFSKNAKAAADYGISLFGNRNTEYILFNSYGPVAESHSLLASYNDILESNAGKLLKREMERIGDGKQPGKLILRSLLRPGLSHRAILDAAGEEGAELIIMGTNGGETMRSVLMGSSAAAVIKHAQCPVMIIPGAPDYQKPSRIAYAVDLRDISSHALLNPLVSLAGAYDAAIMIVNVRSGQGTSEATEEYRKLKKYFSAYKKHSFHPISNSQIESGINEFVHKHKPDLLAMITRQGPPDHRSITQEMIAKINIPLLALPDPGILNDGSSA